MHTFTLHTAPKVPISSVPTQLIKLARPLHSPLLHAQHTLSQTLTDKSQYHCKTTHSHTLLHLGFSSDRTKKSSKQQPKANMGRMKASLAVLVTLAVCFSVNACPPGDRAALLAFRAALNEPYLGIFNSWTGADCCTNWYGVSCDPDHRVADIVLRGESEDPIFEKAGRSGYMSGEIAASVCQLERLTTLVVADWKAIAGEIPACIPSSLPILRIFDLVGNQISGKIPADIGSLGRLTVLNLADNKLTGAIPPSIVNLGSVMHLDLSNNKLTGEIPADVGRLTMMSRALLSRNQLTGSIPSSFANIYRLADIDLSMNRMSGPIPAQLGTMPVLSTLNLDSNQLSGSIPTSLLSSAGLNVLNISRNGLEGNLPDVFGSKTYFTVLDLSYNQLRGSIPKSLSSAKYIGHLDLSYNHLCGPIPVGSPFDHLEASSFANNDCLCGSPLRTC